jgi:hypothetical protein
MVRRLGPTTLWYGGRPIISIEVCLFIFILNIKLNEPYKKEIKIEQLVAYKKRLK